MQYKKKVWLIADTHFGHKGITEFLKPDGTKERPWDNSDKMTEDMVDLWNSVVDPRDKVYHLGDVVINRRYMITLGRLHGEKILIKGNHDLFQMSNYTPYFKDIRACHPLGNFLLTHIPIHPDCLSRWKGNIHGHLHNDVVMLDNQPDLRYYCVSAEQQGFKPKLFDEVIAEFERRLK